MEKRMDGQDVGFDLPLDESDDESFVAPESYLMQHNADPAMLLENSDWQGHEADLLADALTKLDERSLDIVQSRWLAEDKATLHELADKYNVSAERIRQLEKNAMKKLKEAVVLAA